MNAKIAKWVIAAIVLITIGAGYQITRLGFDYEFEHFFPSDDSDLDFYFEFRDKFGTDVDFVLIAMRNEDGIFKEEFLSSAKSMRDALIAIGEVERIRSPFDARTVALGPFGPIDIPYLHWQKPYLYKADSLKIYAYQKGVGTLFSEDAKSIAFLVEIEPNLSKLETDTVYMKMKDVVDQYAFDEMHMAGKVIGQAYYIEQIKFEFALFFSIAILLVVLILSLVYRSVWGVIVPLLIVMLSAIWLLGLMGFIGKKIDIMTALLPLVIFVVGVSDVIHLLSRYFEELRNGHPKFKAIGIAYKQVGMATFLTSFTTALGFLTLLSSGVKPVRELGVYAAVGVFIAFILAFSLLPAILSLTKVPKLAFKEPSDLFWNKLVRKIFFFSMRNQWKVLGATVIVVLVSIWSISRIEVNNYLLEDVGKDDPMRYSFEYFERYFAGARPFELAVTMRDSTRDVFDPYVIGELNRIETYLVDSFGVGYIVSPLTMVRSAHQALNGGSDEAFLIPTEPEAMKKALKVVDLFRKRPEFAALVTEDGKEARISGKMSDVGGKRAGNLARAFHEHFETRAPLKFIDVRLTGMAVLIDKNNETLSTNMMLGLLFALMVVALIMGILFRSFKMALVTLVPNLLPLLVIGAVMGFLGIDLKVSTSIIFGIAFGISVDDSIHYLSKYRLEIGKGRSHVWALRRTSVSTGKAIILTSLILCAGFLTLSTSDFTSTFYVGLLISITLAVAVVADLFVLPVVIHLSKR
ncbi:MAG: MMPL family transporter [Cryomorphaceae bacterium]